MAVSEIRILVADDQRNVRGNLKMILEASGYRVDATGDSEEVVAQMPSAALRHRFRRHQYAQNRTASIWFGVFENFKQENYGSDAEPVRSHHQSSRSHEARRGRLRRKADRSEKSPALVR